MRKKRQNLWRKSNLIKSLLNKQYTYLCICSIHYVAMSRYLIYLILLLIGLKKYVILHILVEVWLQKDSKRRSYLRNTFCGRTDFEGLQVCNTN